MKPIVVPKGSPVSALFNMLAPRSCGECQACCVAFAIRDMRKTAGHPCPAQAPSGSQCGCKIYAVRPQECKTFRCMWLDGHTPLDERPDRVGYILTVHRTRKGPIPMVHDLMKSGEPMMEFPFKLVSGLPWAICTPNAKNAQQMLRVYFPDEMSEQDRNDWASAVAEIFG